MSRQVRYNSGEGHKRGDGASKGNQNITVEGEATRKKEWRKYDFKRGCTKGKKSRGASSNMAAASRLSLSLSLPASPCSLPNSGISLSPDLPPCAVC